MDLEIFKKMDADELRSYTEFLLWHYRVADAFWFLNVEEGYGLGAAEDMNRKVWAKAASLAARDLVKRFGIREKGLKGFVKALKLYPWTPIIDYRIEEKEDEVIISAAKCPPQEARKKHGMCEYACKAMHNEEFVCFAREVDPDIMVECLFAPPDEHPAELYCKWRFTAR
jgi:hypothetical protein